MDTSLRYFISNQPINVYKPIHLEFIQLIQQPKLDISALMALSLKVGDYDFKIVPLKNGDELSLTGLGKQYGLLYKVFRKKDSNYDTKAITDLLISIYPPEILISSGELVGNLQTLRWVCIRSNEGYLEILLCDRKIEMSCIDIRNGNWYFGDQTGVKGKTTAKAIVEIDMFIQTKMPQTYLAFCRDAAIDNILND